MKNHASKNASPELPSVTRKVAAWIPSPLKVGAITRVMNVFLAIPLEAGELEFLRQCVVNICVSDADIKFSVRLDRGRLCAGAEVAEADLTIEGTVYTFLLLATRKVDADTLFFQRQLKTSGDTELGLYVKNFLDGLEPETLPYHRTTDYIMRSSLAVADKVAMIRSRLSKLRSRSN